MTDQTRRGVGGRGPWSRPLRSVRMFANDGYTVFAAARRASALKDLSAPSSARVIPVDVDAANATQVDHLFASAEKQAPVAVEPFSMQARWSRSNVPDTDPEAFERCWRVGWFGGFLVGRAARALNDQAWRGHDYCFTAPKRAPLRGGAGFVDLASPEFRAPCGSTEHGSRVRTTRHSCCACDHRRTDQCAALCKCG